MNLTPHQAKYLAYELSRRGPAGSMVGEERLRGFSTYDFLALDAISREQPLTEAVR